MTSETEESSLSATRMKECDVAEFLHRELYAKGGRSHHRYGNLLGRVAVLNHSLHRLT